MSVKLVTSVVAGLTDWEMQTGISWRWSQAAEESQLSAEGDELFLPPSQALK